MMTSGQLKAARALLHMGQKELAERSGVSLTTIRRMEGSPGTVKSNVDSLVKVIEALDRAGVQLLAEGVDSAGGGRGVRLKS